MNLIERIERKLEDQSTHINPAVFEQCATDLLSSLFPALIPISGGSDSGRDADWIEKIEEPPIRMAITSSRTYEGARRNLISSLESLMQHGLPGTTVVSVSLAVLNQSKRLKLENLASDYGFKLISVVDRSFFIQTLRSEGAWRNKLLQLPGGPFSLSKQSGFGELDQQLNLLVGRDQLVERLSNLNSDAVVWGPPGIGKTTLLENIEGLYFVEGEPLDERLLDDILSTNPRLLAVDDASRRTGLLDLLLRLRKQESLTYLVVAVCWPHERDSVALHLVEPADLEVGHLTRSEIAEIVRQHGVSDYNSLARVLEQAKGRPGWAVRLADLLRRGGEWRSVYSGDALRGEIKSYLLRAGLPKDSLRILAIIGLLGEISELEIPRLANNLGISRMELAGILNEIAIGGLLDVHVIQRWGNPDEVRYAVAPDILAANLVSEIFFAREIPPITPGELFDDWPTHKLAITGTTVRAALLGAEAAESLARQLFSSCVEDPNIRGDRARLTRDYLHLGPSEAKEVLDRSFDLLRTPEQISEISKEDLERFASSMIPLISDAIKDLGLASAIDYAQGIAAALESRSCDIGRFAKEMVDSIRGFGPGGRINTKSIVDVWQFIDGAQPRGNAEASAFQIHLLRECLRPTFEGSWSSVESPRTIELASGAIQASDMQYLFLNVWTSFEERDFLLSRDQLSVLVDVIKDWAKVAGNYALAFGGEPSADQVKEATKILGHICQWVLARSGEFPGLRASIRIHTDRTKIIVPNEKDPVVAAFFDTREPSEDWRVSLAEHRERIANLLDSRLHDPERLCKFLAYVKSELVGVVGWSLQDSVRTSFSIIAERVSNFDVWLGLIVRFGLIAEARVLLEEAIRVGACDLDLIQPLLKSHDGRGTVVQAVLAWTNTENPIFRNIYQALTVEDAGHLQHAIVSSKLSSDTLRYLLDHPIADVRVACAVALLTAGEEAESVDIDLYGGVWHRAILELRIPPQFRLLFGNEDFFEKLLQRAPETYEALFEKTIRNSNAEDQGWSTLQAFDQTASRLPKEARTRLFEEANGTGWSAHYFRILAGSDADWIESLLISGQVDADFVINTINGIGDSPSIEDLARLLLPRGVDPTRIALTVQYGTSWGEDHERIDRYLQEMKKLSESDNSDLRKVGQAGQAYFRPLLERAVAHAREKEIKGLL